MILAVVGSTKFADPQGLERAERFTRMYYQLFKPKLIVSGGAEGVDSMAVRVARDFEIPYEEFYPENPRWAPHGYKARNILIAERCEVLVALRCPESRTYGSGWTADYADKQLGKCVIRVLFHPKTDAEIIPHSPHTPRML